MAIQKWAVKSLKSNPCKDSDFEKIGDKPLSTHESFDAAHMATMNSQSGNTGVRYYEAEAEQPAPESAPDVTEKTPE